MLREHFRVCNPAAIVMHHRELSNEAETELADRGTILSRWPSRDDSIRDDHRELNRSTSGCVLHVANAKSSRSWDDSIRDGHCELNRPTSGCAFYF